MLFNGVEDQDEGDADQGSKPKILLSFCWRAMKEAGSLLVSLVRDSAEQGALEELWNVQDIQNVNEMFTTFLLRIRHRGAFSHIADNYSDFCLVISRDDKLKRLLPEWLDVRLAELTETSSKYSITRRSGGLPFCLLAIATGMRKVFPSSAPSMMARLLNVASLATTESLTKVHTLNAIRVFFLDANFAEDLTSCVGSAFLCAIGAFHSKM